MGHWGSFRTFCADVAMPLAEGSSPDEVGSIAGNYVGGGLLTPHDLALKVAELADSKKAIDIVLLKLSDVTDFVDFFVVCSAQSETQIRAVVDTIIDGLAKENLKVWSSEGRESRSWVLLDYVDVVVHVFLPETRTFYALEKLWGDASVETYPA